MRKLKYKEKSETRRVVKCDKAMLTPSLIFCSLENIDFQTFFSN